MMDLRRFLDLYVTETREHLRALHRSLLALEEAPGSGAIDEAFRAAHTLKGLSAAMGYRAAADQAHTLEDTLEGVRQGRSASTPALVDELLATADALERCIADSVANIPPQLDGGSAAGVATPAAQASPRAVRAPPGTAAVLVVSLAPDAPVKAARAMLITRALKGRPGLIGVSPDPIPEAFDGTLYLYLDAQADAAALRSAVERAGDVASITTASPARPGAADEAAGAVPAARQVRVEEARLDALAEAIGELSVLKNRLAVLATGSAETDVVDRMGGLLGELQRAVLQMRMVPLAEVFERLPRAVRDAARRTGKDVELRIEGEGIELDRSILNEIGDPLMHLVRNAVDHGIEAPAARQGAGKAPRGLVRLRAERERNSVRIVLEDDGVGVDRAKVARKAKQAGLLPADAADDVSDDDLFRVLSHPGFSTTEQVTSVSGRGVGLDAVVSRVRALGGAVDMHSLHGRGTTFSLRLPITLALAQALRVRVGGEDYAIPLTHVSEVLDLADGVESRGGREMVRVREQLLPLVRLRRVLRVRAPGEERSGVVAEFGDRRAALAVDELVGHEQILVKSFDPAPGTLPVFSGATVLEDGRPALVLDPLSVI